METCCQKLPKNHSIYLSQYHNIVLKNGSCDMGLNLYNNNQIIGLSPVLVALNFFHFVKSWIGQYYFACIEILYFHN